MKKNIKITALLLLAMVLTVFLASCECGINTEELWKSATYTESTVIGEGKNTVSVEIEVGDKSIVLTVKTDKATLGEALFENGIIENASFFETCNGIYADWHRDNAGWSFYVNGESALYGVGDEKASTTSSDTYKIAYTIFE